MEIKGRIISGMGKGTYFMSQDIYSKQFQEKLHFKPFVGTLNIKIESDGITSIMNIPNDKFGQVHGKGKFGDVKFIKAVLNHDVGGALVFPAKTKHTEDVLEFISNENLRESLKLKDGDVVTVNID
jgi:Transcriptional regulator of a riboflavin/FAD biosynthetic operon